MRAQPIPPVAYLSTMHLVVADMYNTSRGNGAVAQLLPQPSNFVVVQC